VAGPRDDHSSAREAAAPDHPGRALTDPDWTEGVDVGHQGALRAAISNAMVGLKKRYYGKGPVKAKTYLNDNYVFCVLEGGLTRNEETLIEAGEEELVRSYRLRFQAAMTKPTTEAIRELTDRDVVGYHSQIVFNPARAFEIFVLSDAPAARQDDGDG
jgi:uncharacterized protein YbcI